MFFKKYLGLANVKSLVLQDQLAFLQQVVKAYLIRFPYQNITAFGQYRPVDRHPPGLREVFTANFKGGGGLCAHNNVFLKLQLESLGYDVTPVAGEFVRTGVPLSHSLFIVTIPQRLSKEKIPRSRRYVVDVGCGIPLHEPICLEHLPFRGRAGGFDYKYEWVEKEVTVERTNVGGDALIGEKDGDFISPQNYKFFLRPFQFGESLEPVTKIFRDPHSVFLHQGLYCFRYLDIGQEDFHAVCIRGKELIHITKETRTVETFTSYKEMEPHIYKFFPMINPHEVKLTIGHFSMPFKDALKLAPIRNSPSSWNAYSVK